LAAKPPIARAKVVSYPIRWLAPPAEDVSASGLRDRRLMWYEKPNDAAMFRSRRFAYGTPTRLSLPAICCTSDMVAKAAGTVFFGKGSHRCFLNQRLQYRGDCPVLDVIVRYRRNARIATLTIRPS
jgi:hypothetical protein